MGEGVDMGSGGGGTPLATGGGLATVHASSPPRLWNARRRSRITVLGTAWEK